MISQKVALRLFARRGRTSPSPSSEMNSGISTPTSGRRLHALGRLTDFQISRLQLFEMKNELFADTKVICNHEKLPNNLIADGEINCRSEFHSRQIAAAHCRVRNPAYNAGVIC